MKKILITVFAAIFVFTCHVSVHASVESIDGKITISGNTRVISNNGTVGIYMIKVTDNELTSAIDSFPESVDKENFFEHIGICYQKTNGDYTYSFKFNGESGDYRIYSVSESGICDEGTISFLNTDDYKNAISQVNAKSGTELIDFLKENDKKLSLDFSDLTDERDLKLLAENIQAAKPVLGSSDLITLLEKTKNEVALLNRVASTDIWQQINPILSSQDVVVIDFRYYNLLSDSKKAETDSALVSKRFNTPAELKSVFESKALSCYNNSSSDSHSVSGSSVNGGSGSGLTGGVYRQPNESKDSSNATEAFSDLSNVDWAKEAIEYLYNNGIISGKGDRIFAPNDTISREEIVKIAVSAYKINGRGEISFVDVPVSHWSRPYIVSAVSSGVIKGINDKEFGMGNAVTREDLCVILSRTAKISDGAPKFEDSADISDYAKGAVGALYEMGIVSGYGDGTFKPKGLTTRAEAAVMVYKLLTGGGL